MMTITMISMTLVTTKSPILIGVYIFIQAFMFSLLISSISFSTWASYMLFIVCLGGVLIVFLYVIMTLTIGMELGKSDFDNLLLPILFLFFEENESSNSIETELSSTAFELKFQEGLSLMKISSISAFKFSIFLMILLFLCMVIVVNLTKKKSGTMFKI